VQGYQQAMLGVTELYELGSQQWVTTEVEGLPRILRREPQSFQLSLISRQPTEVHHWQTNIGNGMNELAPAVRPREQRLFATLRGVSVFRTGSARPVSW